MPTNRELQGIVKKLRKENKELKQLLAEKEQKVEGATNALLSDADGLEYPPAVFRPIESLEPSDGGKNEQILSSWHPRDLPQEIIIRNLKKTRKDGSGKLVKKHNKTLAVCCGLLLFCAIL